MCVFQTGIEAVTLYPVYHSVHDSFHWMKTFIDHDFQYNRAVAQVWIELTMTIADSVIVPFNCTRFAQKLKGYTEDFVKVNGKKLSNQNITLGELLFPSCLTSYSPSHIPS